MQKLRSARTLGQDLSDLKKKVVEVPASTPTVMQQMDVQHKKEKSSKKNALLNENEFSAMRELKSMGLLSKPAADRMNKDISVINRAWIFPTYRSYRENNREEPAEIEVPELEEESDDQEVSDDVLGEDL